MTRTLARIVVPALGLCFAAGAAFGSDAPADSTSPKTLGDYLRLAKAANAGLQAANYRAVGAREQVGAAGAMPDPTVQYGYYVAPEFSQSAHGENRIRGRQELILGQEFPFFGKRGLRRDVSAYDARVEAHNARATALDVEYDVKRAFYQYVGLTETARVLATEADLLRRMRDVAQVRYASGTSEQQEVLKIELALSRLADENTVNRRDVAATQAFLNELIGRTADSPLAAPEWVVPDVTTIDTLAAPDSALAHRPDVAAAREQMGRADASRRLAKKEYIPDFMLGVDYEFGAGYEGWWELMAGVNLPIWLGKRGAMVREAEAMQKSAQYELTAATLRSDREVREAAERARAARERYDRFKTSILPQAEAAFSSSEAGYRSGRVQFLDYLDSERTLLETKREYASAISDMGMEMARLERAVGAASEASDK
ncbi:MAG TPA: TolC family protein [Candidatus Krumholzibacteria bacterium]|nr:TolC family protein [Candidatus Krumholzibacteria bacterium]